MPLHRSRKRLDGEIFRGNEGVGPVALPARNPNVGRKRENIYTDTVRKQSGRGFRVIYGISAGGKHLGGSKDDWEQSRK